MKEPDNYRKGIKGEGKEKGTKQRNKPTGDQGMKNIRVRDKVTCREKNWGTKTVSESIRVRNHAMPLKNAWWFIIVSLY